MHCAFGIMSLRRMIVGVARDNASLFEVGKNDQCMRRLNSLSWQSDMIEFAHMRDDSSVVNISEKKCVF